MKRIASAFLIAALLLLPSACTKEKESERETRKVIKSTSSKESSDDTERPATEDPDIETSGTATATSEPSTSPSTPSPKSGNEYLSFHSNDFSKYYIIFRDADGIWHELMESDTPLRVAGEYDNKLYYTTSEGIVYLDLSAPTAAPTKWIKFPEPEARGSDNDFYASKIAMIGDTIYFSYAANYGGSEPTDGLLCLPVTASSIDEATQLCPYVFWNQWEVDEENGLLYYIDSGDFVQNGGTFFRYDPATRSSIAKDYGIRSFVLEESKILLDKEGNIYLYDPSDDSSTFILYELYSLSGWIGDSAAVRDGEVYYLEENRVMKWNHGSPEVFCEYDGDDLYGFLFMNGNAIQFIRQNAHDIYYLDGTYYSDISQVETQKVIMLDGSTQYFEFYP
ncbi:MAG: hypothetical protein IK020_00100 [Clostridiales bacterium]|nr:hypothetical protein [Clostridiales bacterium]